MIDCDDKRITMGKRVCLFSGKASVSVSTVYAPTKRSDRTV